MAADARAIAMGTRDPSAKKTMLDIAADYDRLAKKSEEVGAPTGRERQTDAPGRPMSNEEQHQPGDRAPATAHYEELNVFGTQTGAVVHVREGDPLPAAPRSFTWRRVWREPE